MCQVVPRRVLRVEGERVEVEVGGRRHWVIAPGLGTLAAGDYVVVHAGAALERLAREDAEAILSYYTELDAILAESAEALARSGDGG